MLKKSLIALAIATTAMSGLANAGTVAVNGGSKNVSLEGNLNANIGASVLAAADAAGATTLTIGTAYIINDLVTVTVSGAIFDKTVTPTLTPANAGTVYSYVDFSSDNTVRFRVTTQDEVSGEVLTFAAWSLKTTGATDKSKIKFASTAISTNALIGNYDSATAVDVFAFRTQLKNTITKLNAEVSTGKGRAEFTTGANQDVLKVASVDNVSDVDKITFTKVTHTIKGDFSWVSDYDLTANGGNANGTLDAAELSNAFTTTMGLAAGTPDAVVYTLNTAKTMLTATDTLANALDADISIELNNVGNAAGGSVITAPQSFTISTVATDGTNSVSLAEVSAGAFTLDGKTMTIPYMPYGNNTQVILRITNNGSVSGNVSLRYLNETTTAWVDLGVIGTSTAGQVKDFATLAIDAIKANNGSTKGKVSLELTVNAPSANIAGYAAYKVISETDRGFVGQF